MMYALFAIGVNGSAALLCHYCDGDDTWQEPGVSAWDFEIEQTGANPDDLGLCYDSEKLGVGFHVWVGTRRFSTDWETGASDMDWIGGWSKARTVELTRFLAGATPGTVFADRMDHRSEWIPDELQGGGVG